MERGTVVSGRYRVGRPLGRGGMAEVYEAEDLRLKRRVAIKVLRPELGRDSHLRERFEAEARWAARLSHPNIVAIYDVGEDEGLAYFVMELLPGQTVEDRVRRGRLDEADAVRIIREVLSALASAHTAGILHRDIKPANILLASDGTAKLADFGIAKAFDRDDDRAFDTTANLVVGTPSYVAPERMRGEPASVATELWAVGVVLYELLAGERPFIGDTAVAVAVAAENGKPVPLRQHNLQVTPQVEAVVDRALRPRPEDRFSSAAEMLDALPAADATVAAAATTVPGTDATIPIVAPGGDTRVLPAAQPSASPTSRPEPRPTPARRPATIAARRAVALVLMLLLTGGVIAAAVIALSEDDTPTGPSTSTTTAPAAATTTAPPATTTTAPPDTTTTEAPATTTTARDSTTTQPRATTTEPPTSLTVPVP